MKIALVQSPLAWGELQENLQNFDKKMAECEDCDVILLPEMFTSGCMMIKKSAEVAFAAKESVANAYPVVEEKMLAWAKRQHALVMGSTVYRENGKYYFVPVYTADVVRKVLPNRAATAGKQYSEWRVMDDANFVFSLYSRDLIHVKSKKDIKTNLVNGGLLLQKEIFAYYTGADIATASIAGIANDSNFKFRGLGIQSLEIFEKCQVDILGNISVVRHENRQGFH